MFIFKACVYLQTICICYALHNKSPCNIYQTIHDRPYLHAKAILLRNVRIGQILTLELPQDPWWNKYCQGYVPTWRIIILSVASWIYDTVVCLQPLGLGLLVRTHIVLYLQCQNQHSRWKTWHVITDLRSPGLYYNNRMSNACMIGRLPIVVLFKLICKIIIIYLQCLRYAYRGEINTSLHLATTWVKWNCPV